MVCSGSFPYLYRYGVKLPIANTLAETSAEGRDSSSNVPLAIKKSLCARIAFAVADEFVFEEGRHYN